MLCDGLEVIIYINNYSPHQNIVAKFILLYHQYNVVSYCSIHNAIKKQVIRISASVNNKDTKTVQNMKIINEIKW